ncbi:hypothetical protein GH714_039328 [Hevea brasiliensis]|uniref:Hyaluronan/mRNA-binding protein domain-containing protein n=1 Tax=Hevea brasiliensis TaxID=3981 RepID=A0A6A6MSQ8_HEVBR|nr:hypothetical protein GH714_039328 [Hevea brasiliensis]
MATLNPFDLLVDDDAEDLTQLIAAQQLKAAAAAAPPKKSQPQPLAKQSSKLPSKPVPPAQAVREAKNEASRGGGRGGGRGYGRGRGGYSRDANNENSFSNAGGPAGQGAPEDGDAAKPSERRGYGGTRGGGYRSGGRGGGFTNGEVGDGDRPHRQFERRSGTGRGNEIKREGSGRGNWGNQADELAQVTEEAVNEGEKNLGDEKPIGEGKQ